jgi:hypothetical protein
MLSSPATERRKSKNLALDLQLMSCEAQRDLKPNAIWYSRARMNL